MVYLQTRRQSVKVVKEISHTISTHLKTPVAYVLSYHICCFVIIEMIALCCIFEVTAWKTIH